MSVRGKGLQGVGLGAGLAFAILIPTLTGMAWAQSEPPPLPKPTSIVQPAPLPTWLDGAWVEEQASGRWTEEYWTTARGELMLGASKSGRKEGPANLFEHMRIVRREHDGLPIFIAHPMGGAAGSFPMVQQSASMIEFANAEHDYPQRIRYWRDGDFLRARISLIDGTKAFEWRFRRMGGPE